MTEAQNVGSEAVELAATAVEAPAEYQALDTLYNLSHHRGIFDAMRFVFDTSKDRHELPQRLYATSMIVAEGVQKYTAKKIEAELANNPNSLNGKTLATLLDPIQDAWLSAVSKFNGQAHIIAASGNRNQIAKFGFALYSLLYLVHSGDKTVFSSLLTEESRHKNLYIKAYHFAKEFKLLIGPEAEAAADAMAEAANIMPADPNDLNTRA